MPRKGQAPDYLALARVRRSLRALSNVLTRGAEAAGLTLQQQSFLLALAAYERRDVLLADIREELEMDQATASELLAKLLARRLVRRDSAKDRRAATISFTPGGWTLFRTSVESIRREMQLAQHRAELIALGSELDAYMRFYLGDRPVASRPPVSVTKAGPQRPPSVAPKSKRIKKKRSSSTT
jgi:DNA-binding MarR family transcriptional regulator